MPRSERSDERIAADVELVGRRDLRGAAVEAHYAALDRLAFDAAALLDRVLAAEARLAKIEKLHRMGQDRTVHHCQTGHWTQTTKIGGVRQWVEDPCPTAAALGPVGATQEGSDDD
jgi:hypothetical protein